MRNIHGLFWRDALRGLRGVGAVGSGGGAAVAAVADAGVREEPLRAVAGLAGGAGLSAWRGRSGRRVVVAVHAIGTVDPADLDGAVALAVARPEGGRADVRATTTADALAGEGRRRAWLERAAARGATEVHLHRLAETAEARRAVAADLGLRRSPAGTAASTGGGGPAGGRRGGSRSCGMQGPARVRAQREAKRDQTGPSRRGTRR
ncbi:hypothetical protein [Salinarimonas chemoclinalis]|uniref:hypothetical protein n=1 Tax=Salinarimonas chemoclinalis TaxID=3241599 RepID=UPI003558452D